MHMQLCSHVKHIFVNGHKEDEDKKKNQIEEWKQKIQAGSTGHVLLK